MKYTIKILIGTLYLPFLVLGGIIAVTKFLIVSTFGLAWQKGDDWYQYLMMRLDALLDWLKH